MKECNSIVLVNFQRTTIKKSKCKGKVKIMRLERESSGVAKAGLATGIVGSTLGAVNLMGNVI